MRVLEQVRGRQEPCRGSAGIARSTLYNMLARIALPEKAKMHCCLNRGSTFDHDSKLTPSLSEWSSHRGQAETEVERCERLMAHYRDNCMILGTVDTGVYPHV